MLKAIGIPVAVFGFGLLCGITAKRLPDYRKTNKPILYRITAYCPCERCCGRYADGITASGHKIQQGDKFCAAPPNIPFGTMLDIPDYGVVPVLDRGGVIKGNRLDVFFHTHQQALNWGVKYLQVNFIKKR